MLNGEKRNAKPMKKAGTINSQVEEKLRALIYAVDHCGEGIAICNMDGVLQYTNNAFAEMHGYKPDELPGKHLSIFHSAEQMPAVEAANRQIASTGSFVGEIWHSRRDGTVFLTQMHNTLFMDNSGTAVGMMGTFRDITEQKKAEKMLRKNEEMYRTLCKNIHGMVYRGRLDWTTQFVSKSEDIVGYSSEEFTSRGLTWKDVVFEEDRERVVDEASELAKKPSSIIQKYRIIAKDGSIRWIEDHKTSRFTEEGVFDGVDGIAFNVTQRERLKAELENYKEKVLRAQKHAYINSMGAMMAHQLNQPLTMVSILMGRVIEQLEQESCCPASLKNTREALAEVKNAASTISKFRQYFESPVLEAIGEKVNVSHTANSIISMLSERAEQAKINISAKGLNELPEVEINKTALEQIFLIIIQNAIEAADGRKQHKLDIVGEIADDSIELQFSDDCCGIAPENLEQIFEPFFSTKSYDKGMGLGLDIVQQILTSCGGQIRAESQLGKGTTFYATLPVSNALRS